MTQPIWQTRAGSLGVIPENVFYRQDLVATVPAEPVPARCTATTGTTNIITCDTTQDARAGYLVDFAGTNFGGLRENVTYYVLAVISNTEFTITDSRNGTTTVPLITATGNMLARFYRPVSYRLVAGSTPAGIQIASNGLVSGVPQAVASVQGVPVEVNQDVTSRFVVRAFTTLADGSLDEVNDRTFSLTITGNDVPAFTTPAGAFANNNTAEFVASISGTTMTVSSIISGRITLGMRLRGAGIATGTTVIGLGTGTGTTGTYTVSIRQTRSSTEISGVVGVYFDGDQVVLQIEYQDVDPGEQTRVRLIGGALPPGLRLSSSGLISGYIAPAPNVEEPPGYDLTPSWDTPYDFLVSAISRNYQFTLEVSDGKANDIRTFTIFVYNKDDLTGDDTYLTGDLTYPTADQTDERLPFLINAEPSDIGSIRSDNYFAYRFRGQDYDQQPVEYAISVNQGEGLPPGLTLDPYSGWYYGFIPDQGLTQIEYSFNIQVRARSMRVLSTTSGTNIITVDSTERPDVYLDTTIIFEGDIIGGLQSNTTYYVVGIPTSSTLLVSTSIGGAPVNLTDAVPATYLLAVPADIAKSQQYPFTLSVTGIIDSEVSWITDSDLGVIDNGATSLLKIEAVNVGGRALKYRLRSGVFNELPQGLSLLPSGDIAGKVTFNTFSLDLGATTFDVQLELTVGNEPTTFDSTYRFTANAYAEDTQQLLYKVSEVVVENGGTGYSSAPTITFNTPIGSRAVQATATVSVFAGSITGVTITNGGDGYVDPATFVLTGAGSGAVLRVVMQATGNRDAISVFKDFVVRVNRAYNKPYQNLYIQAMPPAADRDVVTELLSNTEIFVPEYIFRPTDPYFGLASSIIYQHAFGLDPDTLEQYVASLNLNHYLKNLVLGEIKTAQARDVDGNVVYEVVYSEIVDDLVNDQGESVSKIINLPYPIIDPRDGSTVLTQLYPNSLINMRDQVIDVIGRLTNVLPLWMTSPQRDGRVLGYTPAWVLAYTVPGRARQIAYYVDTLFGQRLNQVDFTVDRYVLEGESTRNWDPATQQWTPTPSLTTFDRINTTGFRDQGTVTACTDLAFADVNRRTIQSINELGGLDGATWIAQAGQSPPVGTQVTIRDGSILAFVKQEDYDGPPGSSYSTTDDAWSNYVQTFDETGFDAGSILGETGTYDYGPVVNGGYTSQCTGTSVVSNLITADTTLGMQIGDVVNFVGLTFGGIVAEDSNGFTQRYSILSVDSLNITATSAIGDRITTTSTSDLALGDAVWFQGTNFGGIVDTNTQGLPLQYYVVDIPNATQFSISTSPTGSPVSVSTATGSMTMYLPRFTVTTDGTTAVPLTTDNGDMTVNYGNQRMALWEVSITPGSTVNVDDIVVLSPATQTVTNDYITSSQGRKYTAGTLLYRPGIPQQTLTRVNWQPLITATTVIASETTFDQTSLQFVEPVDMYDPTDQFDKYLVFPKTNILV